MRRGGGVRSNTGAMQLCSAVDSQPNGGKLFGVSGGEGGREGVVVGTEGWAGKTSVILSSMLSHHGTNGLWDFYSPKKQWMAKGTM